MLKCLEGSVTSICSFPEIVFCGLYDKNVGMFIILCKNTQILILAFKF